MESFYERCLRRNELNLYFGTNWSDKHPAANYFKFRLLDSTFNPVEINIFIDSLFPFLHDPIESFDETQFSIQTSD